MTITKGKQKYNFVKMVWCYFLASTTVSPMRRTMTSRGFVGAFLTPNLCNRQQRTASSARNSYSFNNNNNIRPFGSSSSAATRLSLASSSSTVTKSQKAQAQSIPRPTRVNSPPLLTDTPPPLLNLHTITLDELQDLVVSWGHPKFRAKQIYGWIRDKGITNPHDMQNLPKALRETMLQFTTRTDDAKNNANDDDDLPADPDALGGGALRLAFEAISKDGTRKRAYKLRDGQLIESVLMGPYEDGRYTACISSQAGCAMGCVFCATGQMGFARQLSTNEILEQVSRFATELKRQNERLSNIVFMGMGEPLANYRNVVGAISRIHQDLGIGARKITVSTVGVVPSIRKLFAEDTDMLPVRLAVSLHCANDEERTKLLPANARYGGLDELMGTLKDYIETTGRRVTLEWALIAYQNDGLDTARELGNLVRRHGLRRDMVHVNVIPLNPTQGFEGAKPSNPQRVHAFCECLDREFGITATPRVRRGIDIDAGCGQLKAKVQKKEALRKQNEKALQEQQQQQQEQLSKDATLADFVSNEPQMVSPIIGVYDDDDDDYDDTEEEELVEFTLAENAVNIELDDFENPEYETDSYDMAEALRLVSLVEQGAFDADSEPESPPKPHSAKAQTPQAANNEADDDRPVKGPTTSIVDEEAVRAAKKKRKKLLRNLKQIRKLKDKHASGEIAQLNREQLDKIAREDEWRNQVEDLEHNLKS